MNQFAFLGKGLHFPISADVSTGKFLEAEEEKSIEESIKIILMTKKGERLMRPGFGCNIWQYLFEVIDLTTISMIEEAVTDSLIEWEPRIRDITVHAEPSRESGAALVLSVNYCVRTTNNPYNLVFPYYLEEGIVSG